MPDLVQDASMTTTYVNRAFQFLSASERTALRRIYRHNGGGYDGRVLALAEATTLLCRDRHYGLADRLAVEVQEV